MSFSYDQSDFHPFLFVTHPLLTTVFLDDFLFLVLLSLVLPSSSGNLSVTPIHSVFLNGYLLILLPQFRDMSIIVLSWNKSLYFFYLPLATALFFSFAWVPSFKWVREFLDSTSSLFSYGGMGKALLTQTSFFGCHQRYSSYWIRWSLFNLYLLLSVFTWIFTLTHLLNKHSLTVII